MFEKMREPEIKDSMPVMLYIYLGFRVKTTKQMGISVTKGPVKMAHFFCAYPINRDGTQYTEVNQSVISIPRSNCDNFDIGHICLPL